MIFPLDKRGRRGYNKQAFDFEELLCECAGIGRQASLRCLCSTGRVGSSPITRTIPQNESNRRARVVELADSLDSGSSAHYGRAGSSPASRTKKASTPTGSVLFSFPGRKRRGVVVQPTRLQKYERLRDGFLARRVRARAKPVADPPRAPNGHSKGCPFFVV